MVSFKTWKDHCQFLLEYKKYSCMNCVGYNGDMDSGLFVCMRTLSPVRLSLLDLCVEWENKDGLTLDDVDWNDNIWKLSPKMMDEVDKLEDVSFEEVTELIQMFEKELDG